MLRLYNTLTKKVETFEPLNPPNIGYYSCGPTVYDFAHIGHARTYFFADILQRVLEFNGFKIKRVMNITDVGHLTSDSDSGEDKMEKGARREKKTVWEIANFYTQDFFEVLSQLNIKKPPIICRATDHIKEMISLIRKLEEKGYTYKIADGVYFDTSKLPYYGRLTGKTLRQLQKSLRGGARVEVVAGKKQLTDFALWKFTPKGVKRQMEWDSPYGRGFPGWHIECSAMSMKFLGSTFDIHTGGVDHIPIHHTNEIAQSEAATGKPFVKYWLHAEHLLVEGAKMSKSKGNYLRVKDLVDKGYNPLALRFLFLTSSYRQQLNFTWKGIEAAQHGYSELLYVVAEIKKNIEERQRVSLSAEKSEKVDQLRSDFTKSINDDLNTAQGLAILWQVSKSNIPAEDKYDLILLFDEVLGLRLNEVKSAKPLPVPSVIMNLVNMREALRQNNQYLEADSIRKKIVKLGYIIEDTPQGPTVKSKS